MTDVKRLGSNKASPQREGIQFLVESALRKVARGKYGAENLGAENPGSHQEWVQRLCAVLMDESDTPYQNLIASMMANGTASDEIYDRYVPEAARHLGELWVQDKASFVDVTVGASRLQTLFRNRNATSKQDGVDRTIPLGQSVLMVVPVFEDHSVGAFVVADQFRRHGLWVHMAIGLETEELQHLVGSGRFAMVGITSGSIKMLEPLSELIDCLRAKGRNRPPIVVGGHIVTKSRDVEQRIGADFAVRTAREAIERCGLASVAAPLSIDSDP